MPAKKPAPKPAAKGKKAASRPAARKAAPPPPARKPERAKAAVVPARKPAAPAPAAVAAPAAQAKPAAGAAAKPAAHRPAAASVAEAPVARKVSDAPPPPGAPRPAAPAPSRATHAPDADDAEAGEPGSLLAGPRNVQPYIIKRGEAYMSREQLDHFRTILNTWKRDLMEEVDRTVSHMKDEAANFPDPNDRATQEEEFSLELRTRDRERKLIRKIEEAIKRVDDGSFGYCLETGEEIGVKRLEARPVATLTIEAQERRERRERQYGDRDDRYR
jgi:DnaK suppressor protein